MANHRWSRFRLDWEFWLLVGWLGAIFLMGGGARDDILSLVVLRPLSVAMAMVALFRIDADALARHRTLLVFAGAIFLLPLLHLIPLPPALWHTLPQRELIAEIDDAAGLGDRWRAFSIAPQRTWNAWFSLFVPLSVLLFAVRLDATRQGRLVMAVLGIGFASALLGVLQIAGSASSPLYFYDIHTPGAPVGLFANRNHQGAFLATLLPMLAFVASRRSGTAERQRFRLISAAAAGAILIPLLIVNGSRAGIILGLAGLASVPFILRLPISGDSPQKNLALRTLALGGAAVGLLALATAFMSRATALNRLWGGDEGEEYRLKALEPVFGLLRDYMPLGSGMGTFVEAFFRREPAEMLAPVYLNHAHFDYLELAITGGLPALLLVAVGIVGLIQASRPLLFSARTSEAPVRLGRTGLAVIAILAAASAVDYPLRTPSLMALLVLAIVWLRAPAESIRSGARDPKGVDISTGIH